MLRSGYSVSLCCSVYCLCVNVYCNTAIGVSTQLQLTITSYHIISYLYVPIVLKSGSLNLLESSGPVQACNRIVKVKVSPQQAEVAQGVLGRLRPRIFLTFRTTRVVGRQPHAPAAFTPGEIPGTHFQRLSRLQAHGSVGGSHGKKSPVTPPGIDPDTVRLVAQFLNLYANPDPVMGLFCFFLHKYYAKTYLVFSK